MNTKIIALLLSLTGLSACGGSLNSLADPERGMVSGLVCNDLPLLLAATEPAIERALIQEGKCIKIRNYMPREVEFVRTVMMPGDGKYSQFELETEHKTQKMWIQTVRAKQTG
ncbi:MAG: hypothetical protein VB957_01610 [Pseudomonadales bacterium]|jgi:hypothetical protein